LTSLKSGLGGIAMRTVKQVSELTGISIRTIQYYDEIGLLKPSKVTEAGYRMYDDDSLELLQQILFFKELDFQLKDIKRITQNPTYDKKKALQNQKELIQVKRNRLDGLLELLDKLIEGEKCMSFKEFDMSEYFSLSIGEALKSLIK
jgi:DNA-binding transcriptional MerR regulator